MSSSVTARRSFTGHFASAEKSGSEWQPALKTSPKCVRIPMEIASGKTSWLNGHRRGDYDENGHGTDALVVKVASPPHISSARYSGQMESTFIFHSVSGEAVRSIRCIFESHYIFHWRNWTFRPLHVGWCKGEFRMMLGVCCFWSSKVKDF